MQELVVTDDLEIEAPEITSTGIESVPDEELEQMYTDLKNQIFGTNP